MNLKLVWHIFRTDARHLRWLILAVWVAIIIDAWPFLANSLWQLPFADGSSSLGVPNSYARSPGSLGQSWLVPAGWLLAVALGCNGRDAFRLSPVRRIDVAAAKLLFLCLLVYVPQWITISLVFWRHEIAFSQAWPALMAASAIFVPLWLIALALGRLAGNLWRSLGVILTISVCIKLLGFMLRELFPLQGDLFFDVMTDSWGNKPGAFAWVLVGSVAGGLILLVRFTISKWQTSRRCLVAVLSTLVMVIAISEVPPLSVDASPASLSSIDQNAIDAIQPVIMGPLRNLLLENDLNADSPKYLSANIEAKNLPPDTYCDWMQVNKPFSTRKSFLSHPFAMQYKNHRALYHAIQKELPNVNVRNQHNDFRNETSIMYQSSSAEGIYGKSISLRGVLCRVELVANIPFDTDGVSVPLQEGWIHAKRFREPSDSTPHVDLIMHGGVFGSGSIPSQLSWNVDVTQLRQVFLYVPKSGKAYYCRESDAFNGKGPLLSSGHIHRTIMSLTHTERFVKFDESDLEGARLLIFSPRILRLLDRTLVVLHDIPIESNQDSNHDADFVAGPEVAPKDFFVEAISRRPDPEKASDEQFGRWMLFCERNVRMQPWLTREYCEWLPEKLSIMLEGDPNSPLTPTRNAALFAAWPESRKREVISQLPEKPWLLELIAERGWLQDSKHEILQLLESGNKSFDLLTYVAMLEEPSTYDRLLEYMSISGNVSLYHALSRIPSLADQLDHAVKSYFARVTTRGLPPDGLASRESPIRIEYLDVPLMHGLPDAMRDALVIFHACEAEKYTYTREHLAKHLILPAGIDYENNNLLPFFRDLRLENLQWDALARRWRINETSLPKS